MLVSVEISLYPLDKNYSASIRDFIDRMNKKEGIQMKVNEMSSFIYGEYDKVMKALTEEIKTSFTQEGVKITVLKVVNMDMTEQ
jgi:uncharacterized protein YqgV (UPF0045/DUF77 family)